VLKGLLEPTGGILEGVEPFYAVDNEDAGSAMVAGVDD
jgi:hypothetical protein